MNGSKIIKKKEIELKKQIILEEAMKLIDKAGFKNAKMEDIAKNVGFSKASLYSYFRDKEEIAAYIAKSHLLKFYNKISDLPEKTMPVSDKLSIMREAHAELIRRSKNFMIIKLNFKIMEKAHKEFIELKIKILGVLKAILEEGKKQGKFNKDLDSDSAANLLESMFTGIVFLDSLVKNISSDIVRDFDLERMIGFAMDFFYLGITNTNTEMCK